MSTWTWPWRWATLDVCALGSFFLVPPLTQGMMVLFIYFYAMSTGLKVRNATRQFMKKEEEEEGATRDRARVALLEGGDWSAPDTDLLGIDVTAGRRLLQEAKTAGVARTDWITAKNTLDRAAKAQKDAPHDPEAGSTSPRYFCRSSARNAPPGVEFFLLERKRSEGLYSPGPGATEAPPLGLPAMVSRRCTVNDEEREAECTRP